MLNLLGVIIAFIIIIFLIRRKYNFGLSLILGSLIVGVFSLTKVNAIEIPKAILRALIYSVNEQQFKPQTIELVLLMLLIYILAKLMQDTGAINKVINSLRSVFSKGGILGIIPALYGLMPIPGGALFSAPLIDKEGIKFKIHQNQKNFLNVWFRHIWFPIYPISSAMNLICGADFSNIDIYHLIVADIPSFLAFILIGYIFLKLFIKNDKIEVKEKPKRDLSGIKYLLPPVIPVIIYIIVFILIFIYTQIAGIDYPDMRPHQIRIFILGIIGSIILLFYLTKSDKDKYFEIIKKSVSVNLALAIIGIMIFREIFNVSQANVVITDIIGGLPFPPLVIIILVPLILGLLTGYNLGAIALSYFLVAPLFELSGINTIGLTSLIFTSSLVGYLISPIHLCNVLSSDYLKTDTTRMYKMYIPAVTVLLLVQTLFILFAYSN